MVTASYAQKKTREAERNRANSLVSRDIAPLPKVVNPDRREKCRLNLRLFCEEYYRDIFNLAWSDDHLKIIARIEQCVLNGGQFAIACPRASGKTNILLAAAAWAILYGHRKFVLLIGATEEKAGELISRMKGALEHNNYLFEDFPEVCYPIRCIGGMSARVAGQLLDGERTRIGWNSDRIVLPSVPGSAASGAVVRVAGITGAIRGMTEDGPNGTTKRPDFVVLDDPQTDTSASSPVQVRERKKIIQGSVLGLAGPGKKTSCFAALTVINRGDVADQLLDRKEHPDWQGERIKCLKSFPGNTKMWEEYAEIRAKSIQEGRGIADATEFYRKHQKTMDSGGEASWPARYECDEVSAIQHAMNLKIKLGEEAFAAEYQNEPLAAEHESSAALTPEEVFAKVIPGLERGIVPQAATKLVAFIDVQKTILFYTVCAFDQNFTGHVVDYGSYPEQNVNDYRLKKLQRTFSNLHPGMPEEAQIYAALGVLTNTLLDRKWARQGGGDMQISRILIDAGYNTSVVRQFCRDSKRSALLIPSFGRAYGPERKPLNETPQKIGERQGWNWRVLPNPDHYAFLDTNAWKSFLVERVRSSPGENGNLSLFAGTKLRHAMFCRHLASEYPTLMESMGRAVNEWHLKPGQPDNHFLDCVVGCCAAASEQGILFVGHQAAVGGINRKRRRCVATF